jgi:alkanesulfonate monooxygenase SsuD/methylene tetrahydromethanopterin reductase-like flavin-dependent oxidoreductase (luciferase family)
MSEAVRLYRERFQPSAQLARPYIMLGFNAFAAETEEEAQLLVTSVQQAFVNLRTGKPAKLPPPVPGYADTLPLPARAMLRHSLSCSAIGTRDTVRAAIAAFAERNGADELMVTSQIYDHQARLRSYEIVAEAMGR